MATTAAPFAPIEDGRPSWIGRCADEDADATATTVALHRPVVHDDLVARAHMLVGGIVEAGAGRSGAVVAFVAVSLGIEGSRMFKVHGPASSPRVDELPAATTVDLGRFRRELESELQAEIDAVTALGGAAAISQPQPGWVCSQVARHLSQSEGLAIE